jgi:hypothetical protein
MQLIAVSYWPVEGDDGCDGGSSWGLLVARWRARSHARPVPHRWQARQDVVAHLRDAVRAAARDPGALSRYFPGGCSARRGSEAGGRAQRGRPPADQARLSHEGSRLSLCLPDDWGQRGLLLLNLLLAIPTVLVAAQADVAQRLDAREFRLAELRVDFTARERAAELNTAIEAAKNDEAENSPQPDQVQITQAANHIGQVFERSLGEALGKLVRSSRSGDELAPAELIKARADMRAAKARREVLLISAADRPDGGVYVDTDPIKPGELALRTGSVSRAAERERLIPGLLDASMNAASDLAREDGKPITAIGRAVARQLQELMMTSATARDAVMSARASFQEVARPSQVANILLTEMFSGTSHVATADFMTPEMSARHAGCHSDPRVGAPPLADAGLGLSFIEARRLSGLPIEKGSGEGIYIQLPASL